MLVDCDVHVSYDSLRDLRPYLDPANRDLVDRSGTYGLAMPTYPWNHPAGWIRKDTYESNPARAGMLSPAFDLDQLRDHVLDRHDVTYAITIPDDAASFSVLPNPRLAAALCSAYNNWLLERWLQEDRRLRGTLVVPAQHPEAAADEIRRLGGRDEFAGVFLPGGSRIPYGNPVYDPIWEAASEAGLPVVVHVHYEGVGISGPLTAAGYPDFYTEFHTLTGSSLCGHLISILCHGIFERFPDARVMLMEGGLVPYVGYLWRLDVNWRSCRTEIPWCRRRPSDYVWEHVRFSTQPLEEPDDTAQLESMLEPLRPWQTLCYASDYPHWDFDDPMLTLRTLPAEWRNRIAARNALEFYRLPVPAPVDA
jgi:predicted TIM-barrel fold metal-dependent hydrolase